MVRHVPSRVQLLGQLSTCHPFKPAFRIRLTDRPTDRDDAQWVRRLSHVTTWHAQATMTSRWRTTCTSGDWRQRQMMDARWWWIFSRRPVSSSSSAPSPAAAAAASSAAEPLSMGHVNTMKLLTSSACLPLDFFITVAFFTFFSFYIGMSGVARRIYAISDCHSVFSQ